MFKRKPEPEYLYCTAQGYLTNGRPARLVRDGWEIISTAPVTGIITWRQLIYTFRKRNPRYQPTPVGTRS